MIIGLILILSLSLIPSLFHLAYLYFRHWPGYEKSSYYALTHTPYWPMRTDNGRFGEFLCYKELKGFEDKGSRFLFNVYLPKADQGTSEIDVLLLTPKGLFVLESKNYSGWIFGSETQSRWTQSLAQGKGSHKESFYNPILQNRSHLKHLKAFLKEELPCFSVVVFSERCELKRLSLSGNVPVVKRSDLFSTVNAIYREAPTVLSPEQIEAIYQSLYPLTQVSDEVKEQHVEAIREATAPAKAPEDKPEPIPEAPNTPPLCPRCGAPLLPRTASRGANKGQAFLGCSSFPKCRYVQSLTETKKE